MQKGDLEHQRRPTVEKMELLNRLIGWLSALSHLILLAMNSSSSESLAVTEHLVAIRDNCLLFAKGVTPNDEAVIVIRHGLWAQGPFSPNGEVDLAATGFALASLPAAAEAGLFSEHSSEAEFIARDASTMLRSMIEKSSNATTLLEHERYGYSGMLFHYYTWSDVDGEFHGNSGTEVSSVDTVIALFGWLACAEYFGGSIRQDFTVARSAIRWSDWLDKSPVSFETNEPLNQFRMAYHPKTGFEGWWDFYTQEAMLVCLMALSSDSDLDASSIWRAWNRNRLRVSTATGEQIFAIPYFGDPFTVFYGQAFIDFERLGQDIDGINWFEDARSFYQDVVLFFREHRGYLGDMVLSFFHDEVSSGDVVAKHSGSNDAAIIRKAATVYGIAGGLPYFSSMPESNPPATTLGTLYSSNEDFLGWHGWPVATVDATRDDHPIISGDIIGQDILLIGLMIHHFLGGIVHDLILSDPQLQRVFVRLFPNAELPQPTRLGGDRKLR